MFLHESPDTTQYYCFNNLSQYGDTIVHGVFTRHGGISDLNFKSLNVGLTAGDDKDSVWLNRKIVAKTMGAKEGRTIYLNQVHGKNFLVLRGDNSNGCKVEKQSEDNQPYQSRQDADGIITNIKGILTVMQVADCQAVILYDPVNQVIANIHSGWRGSLLNIIGRGVDIMVEKFDSSPASILAAVSPSLGPCCAEFKNYREEIPEYLWRYRVKSTDNDYYFDFWQMSFDQLTDKGIPPQNIEVAGVCTTCSSHIFYSYRKENITGRFAVASGLV